MEPPLSGFPLCGGSALLAVADSGSFPCFLLTRSARQPSPCRTGDSGAPAIPEL